MADGERELVRWLQQRTGPSKWPVLLGIGDDMAIVEVGGTVAGAGATALITSDMLMDGVHFQTAEHSLEQIGRKAIACSLSDCAAMAVRPVAATVSVAWPAGGSIEDAKRLFNGMQDMAGQFDCAIVGGDTTSWKQPLAIDVAMIASEYADHPPVLRSGARTGDTLYVTGPLGGSRLGRHMSFVPRVREARSIAATMGPHLHAMMDLSDGLSLDLHRMCEASNVGAELIEDLFARVISDDARRVSEADGVSPLRHALDDGEDFELLLAVGGDAPEPPAIEAVYLHPVGRVVADGITLRRHDGSTQPVEPAGYEHLL
ncbi:MAG TPA: thiamine-phosphate kinase [Phycisphaerae bacterium]|nr:thiamine-phosphate kinase [Phycisphaerae bacterium]